MGGIGGHWDIAFKVYNTQKARKIKQATVLLEMGVMRPEEEAGPQREKERPTGHQSICLLQIEGPLEKGAPGTQKGK